MERISDVTTPHMLYTSQPCPSAMISSFVSECWMLVSSISGAKIEALVALTLG